MTIQDWDWLQAASTDRPATVRIAATNLLAAYLCRWSTDLPVNVYRLSWTLDVQIQAVNNLSGGARIIPRKGGFSLLLNSALSPYTRRRSAIAHELAHTLFYDRSADLPRRPGDASPLEERFCFDVARQLLVPWVLLERDLQRIWPPTSLDALIRHVSATFQCSRLIAAHVVLRDYGLAEGVAGRLVRAEGKWKVEPTAAVSESLDRKGRLFLWDKARSVLEGSSKDPRVTVASEAEGASAFVTVDKYPEPTWLERDELAALKLQASSSGQRNDGQSGKAHHVGR